MASVCHLITESVYEGKTVIFRRPLCVALSLEGAKQRMTQHAERMKRPGEVLETDWGNNSVFLADEITDTVRVMLSFDYETLIA